MAYPTRIALPDVESGPTRFLSNMFGGTTSQQDGLNEMLDHLGAVEDDLLSRSVNVSNYGSPITHTTIQAAIDASFAAGGGDVWLPAGTITVTGAIALKSGVTLRGAKGGTILKLNSASVTELITGNGGSFGTTATLASNGAQGATQVVLTAGSVAAKGLAVGDLIEIQETGLSLGQFAIILAIATETLTLNVPLYEDYTTANGATVRKLASPLLDAGLEDLVLDGSLGTAATSIGFLPNRTKNLTVKNVVFRAWQDAGLRAVNGYATILDNVRFEDCGSGGYSDLWMLYQTGYQVSNLHSYRASGFGPLFNFTNGGEVTNLNVSGAASRSIKIDFTSYSAFTNLKAEAGLSTGIALTSNSHDNVLTNAVAIHNAEAGLWCDGVTTTPGASRNQFRNCISKFNVTRNLEIGASAADNVFDGDIDLTGLLSSGSGTVIKTRSHGQTGFATGVTSGPTTTSVTYVDLTDMSVTRTTTGGDLLVWFSGSFNNASAGVSNFVALSLDGAAEVSEQVFASTTAFFAHQLSTLVRFSGVAAGSHTVKVRWKVDGGTGTALTTRRQLLVQETNRS